MADQNIDQEKIQLHNTLIKQQELLLKQYEVMAREKEKKEEEIDLRRIFGGWFSKKKQTKETSETQKEEIDNQFLHGINLSWTGLKRLARLVTFNFYKRIGIIAIFGGLGLGMGLYIKYTSAPVYKTSMTLSSGTLPNNYYSSLLFTLEELVANRSYGEIAKKLNLPLEKAEQVKTIQYKDYLDAGKKELNDSTLEVLNRPFFRIYAEVTDNSILPDLQEGVFTYIAENQYAKRRREVRKQNLENNIKKLGMELQLMDSLRVAVIRQIESQDPRNNQYFVRESGLGGGLILSKDQEMQLNPLDAFSKTKELYDEQQKALRDLLLIENEIDIVDEFAVYQQPVFPRMRHVAIVAIAGAILGYCIGLAMTIMELRKKKA
ncbi:hypothetical protein QWY31_03840 [Cytophagales bacterium LB-30]|uniref:LPS O-antigen length regulator n=1 Tax=Shiella aurantiaca TaxID=3058365 RepID=A0ABT8F2L0_9BACT|nr:hypothetical protein [Shiella aurantiaca]MDN4164618.1 hypothetical protein [Shiella aurantiaca]